MTIEEAIEYFKERIEYCNRYERKDLSDKYILAIEALEKQIPKKPIITEFINDEIAVYECKCGLAPQFRYKEHKHCPECGQKLDWGKDE